MKHRSTRRIPRLAIRPRRGLLILAAAWPALCASAAWAAETPDSRELEEVRIAATRANLLAEESARALAVIDAAQIAERPGATGIVREEFLRLARQENLDAQEKARLEELKADMADRLLAQPAEALFDVAVRPQV